MRAWISRQRRILVIRTIRFRFREQRLHRIGHSAGVVDVVIDHRWHGDQIPLAELDRHRLPVEKYVDEALALQDEECFLGFVAVHRNLVAHRHGLDRHGEGDGLYRVGLLVADRPGGADVAPLAAGVSGLDLGFETKTPQSSRRSA